MQFLSHHLTTPKLSRFHIESAARMLAMRRQRNQRINIMSPRGAAKSTWWTLIYPLQESLARREMFITITSDTAKQAAAFLRRIRREIEDNPLLAEAYPEACGRGPIWNHDHIELRNGVTITACGTGGKIRGSIAGSNRPTLIIVDDPQNKDHIVSELKRQRSMEWLTKDVVSAGQPGTNIVTLGTALHQESIVCTLAMAAGWDTLRYESIIQFPDRMDLWDGDWIAILFDHENPRRLDDAREFYERNREQMDAGAVVLWRQRESLYDLMLLRASIGPSAFASEKQNNPINPDQCEWPDQYFDRPDLYFDQWPADLQVRTLALDPSKGSGDKASDYWSFVRFGRDSHEREYVDADLQRGDLSRMIDAAVRHVREFKPEAFAVETNAFQQLLVAPLRQALRNARLECPIVEVENMVSKLVRIRRLTTPICERRLRFKRASPGVELLLNQLRQFPVASHDDGPDALEQARRVAIRLFNATAQDSEHFGKRVIRA